MTGQTGCLSLVQGDEDKKCLKLESWFYLGPEQLMHKCTCVSACGYEALCSPFHLVKLKQFYTSYFLFLSRNVKSQNTEPIFTYTVPNLTPCCMSQPGLSPGAMSPVWDKRTGRLGWVDIRGPNGGTSPPSYPSTTSHPPLAVVRPVSLGLSMARWDAVGRGGHIMASPPLTPSHCFKLFSQSLKKRGLSLRRCCLRSWMWRPQPWPRCLKRPQICECEAWGRGRWPAGAHRCGPLYGRLDNAL